LFRRLERLWWLVNLVGVEERVCVLFVVCMWLVVDSRPR
jgi:hypothetical protein